MDSHSNLQILFLAQQSSIRLMQFMHLCFIVVHVVALQFMHLCFVVVDVVALQFMHLCFIVVDVVVVALLTVVVDECDGHFPQTGARLLYSNVFFKDTRENNATTLPRYDMKNETVSTDIP